MDGFALFGLLANHDFKTRTLGVDPRDYPGHENVDLTLDVYIARGGGSGKVADVLGGLLSQS